MGSVGIEFYLFENINLLTHGGRDACICVGILTSIGSDNGLSPGRRQTIIWTNAGILLIEPLGTNFSEILMWIQAFSFKKMHLKMTSAKWRQFCIGINVLMTKIPRNPYACVQKYTWIERHTWSMWLRFNERPCTRSEFHYNDAIMSSLASQITSLAIVYPTAYSRADQRKHQSSVSLAFVWGIHRDRWIPPTKGQ